MSTLQVAPEPESEAGMPVPPYANSRLVPHIFTNQGLRPIQTVTRSSLLALSAMTLTLGIGAIQLWKTPEAHPLVAIAAILGIGALACQLRALIDNRRALIQVTELTLRDPLTGLANRQLFSRCLRETLRTHSGDHRTVVLLVLDLHDFALVNDNLGYRTGDALLRVVAERLLRCVPTNALVAHLNDDDFAILVPDTHDPESIAPTVLDAFNNPFLCNREELIICASIGFATTPTDGEHVGADQLFRRANIALNRAKLSGLGSIQSWHPDIHGFDAASVSSQKRPARRAEVLPPDIQVLGQLRRAINSRELSVAYQPQIALDSGARVGVEALIRWPHPELGLLLPDQFLPLVRHHGLMTALTEVVLDQAIGDAATWRASGADDISVAVNLFAPSLTDVMLPSRIDAALTTHQLPPGLLTVEITEHFLLTSLDHAQAVVRDLRDIGVRIAIDDFGSGYANMSYLQDLHIDELKLDRQFIAPVLSNVRSAAIVRSIIDLSHILGITSVAEGVEDEATASWLRNQHCDIAQGYYFSKPMSANNIHGTVGI